MALVWQPLFLVGRGGNEDEIHFPDRLIDPALPARKAQRYATDWGLADAEGVGSNRPSPNLALATPV